MLENPVRRIFLLKSDDRRSGVAGWLAKEDGAGVVTTPGSPELWSVMLNTDPICSSKLSCVVTCFSFNSGAEVSVKFSPSQTFLKVAVVFLSAEFSAKPTVSDFSDFDSKIDRLQTAPTLKIC